jgi:hypothetical protein
MTPRVVAQSAATPGWPGASTISPATIPQRSSIGSAK